MNTAASSSSPPTLSLAGGLSPVDLYRRAGLEKVDAMFGHQLQATDTALAEQLGRVRANPAGLAMKDESALIIALAPHLDAFIGKLFGIESAMAALEAKHHSMDPLWVAKRKFVAKKINQIKPEQAAAFDALSLTSQLEEAADVHPLTEASYAAAVTKWMQDEKAYAAELKLAAEYAGWAVHTAPGRAKHSDGVLFKMPHKLDPQHLIPIDEVTLHGAKQIVLGEHPHRHREGFHLTDPGTDLRGALDQASYCIKCHHQAKDSCSKGLREKTGEAKTSAFGVPLAGCPLEEKISEMHEVKEAGYALGALAIITVDNPMCAGTGHRICNDCMKSCIYQKQEPVDIPQAETRTLKDVLELPWGFEIYSLLTRWNPLNFARPMMKPDTGRKVLVVGLGPAGFTLAHHLMNDGHTVVAVDGLKIEPLDPAISGVDAYGKRAAFEPLHDINKIYERLDQRTMAGFGGVAEYGITVRWNKNFLKVIRLLLERREQFAMYGGVRFGGTMTVDSAFAMGFDHIALCMGAGRPTVIPMKNGLARGVRQASDFLMALQLTGAAKAESLANLQVSMPIVVIGGGLTAIDTATESLAYYPVQVEKFLRRYEELVAMQGEAVVQASWKGEFADTSKEFIAHARAIRAERTAAAAEHRTPKLLDLLNSWGGVTVAYRRRMIDSPSYTLNHEEIMKALEEGIRFAECLSPDEVVLNEGGGAVAIKLSQLAMDATTGKLIGTGHQVTLPARTILVAAGTQPNTVLAREDEHNVRLHGRFFQAVDEHGEKVTPERISKPKSVYVLMSQREDGRALSFFGDLHPSFAGNVVKAMGSAKQGFPVVSRSLERVTSSDITPTKLIELLNDQLRPVIHEVIRLTPNIVEVVVRAPIAARAFKPGQFYRLQNFESAALRTHGTALAMEGLALTGASVNLDKGFLSTIVLEMGGSSDLCSMLKPGEPVVLMGPTGTPTETPGGETVLLIGGGLGNAVLFSIGQELRAQGSRVIYFAGYKKIIDRYKIDQIEAAADVVTWCCDEAPGFTPGRVQDRAFVGNIVAAMKAYATGDLGEVPIPLGDADRLVVIGSDGMMRGVQEARHTVLRDYLKPGHNAIGSINSPMQCMMKEICAQCLQQHTDPVTGEETVVFSCSNQDQPLDHVRFDNLRTRLSQNSVQENLTRLWIRHCLADVKHQSAAEERAKLEELVAAKG